MREQAAEEGLTAVQFAIQWVLRQPRVTSAIVGIKSVRQLDENAVATGSAAV